MNRDLKQVAYGGDQVARFYIGLSSLRTPTVENVEPASDGLTFHPVVGLDSYPHHLIAFHQNELSWGIIQRSR